MVVQHLHTVPGVSSNLTFTTKSNGAFVYRLGHQVFILRRGVRLPYALPSFVRVLARERHTTNGFLRRTRECKRMRVRLPALAVQRSVKYPK